MKADAQRDVDRILTEHRRVVDQALDRGIRKAILRHKKDGPPVVIERVTPTAPPPKSVVARR